MNDDKVKDKLDHAADLYQSGDLDEARSIYFELANSGSIVSQRFLGWMFYRGDGVEVNKSEALRWFTKAAEQGDLEAMFGMARVYMSQKYNQKAFVWYQKSATEGFLPSMYWEARFYREGIEVDQDREIAYRRFNEAATKGHLQSMREVSIMLITGYKGIFGVIKGLALFAKFIVLTIKQGFIDPLDYKGMI